MQLRSVRSWRESTRTMLRPTALSPSGFVEFKDPESGFEDSLQAGSSSTITTDEIVEAVERIVVRDRQISVHRLAYELPISTTTVYEIMSNHLGMKKVSTRWVPKLLTPIQHSHIVVKSFCKTAK